MVQGLRIHLPMQWTWVPSVDQEDAASRRAAKPVHCSCWTHVLEPESRNSWSPRATTPEAYAGACALQQERPLQKPSHCKSGVAPCSPELEKVLVHWRRPCTAKINKIFLSIKKKKGTSLVVPGLRLCAPNAGGLASIADQGTRSHMPQLIPSTAK